MGWPEPQLGLRDIIGNVGREREEVVSYVSVPLVVCMDIVYCIK